MSVIVYACAVGKKLWFSVWFYKKTAVLV